MKRPYALLYSSSVLFAILVITSVTSCSRPKKVYNNNLELFKTNLKADMDQQELMDMFGSPAVDYNGDMSIYKYHLSDTSEVWIGYSDKMEYACYVDDRQNFVQDLISIQTPIQEASR